MMSSDIQNFTNDKSDSDSNLFVEIILTVTFVTIIILSALVLFGS
jgi:hypothetical protein